MSNYKERSTDVSVTEWLRSFKVTIDNTYKQIPIITFLEEKIQIIGETVIRRSLTRKLSDDLSNPTKSFPKLNPDTGEVIGEYTDMDLYLINYSKYMSLAKADDEKKAVK